jgi:hypothetical protein
MHLSFFDALRVFRFDVNDDLLSYLHRRDFLLFTNAIFRPTTKTKGSALSSLV